MKVIKIQDHIVNLQYVRSISNLETIFQGTKYYFIIYYDTDRALTLYFDPVSYGYKNITEEFKNKVLAVRDLIGKMMNNNEEIHDFDVKINLKYDSTNK